MIGEKAVKNASWIILCRIVQALLGMIISMMTARYLGPSNFGLINYAASIVAFVIPVMQLGLSNILVHELIEYPAEEGKILGTSLALSLCSGMCCMVGVTSFVMIVNAGEKVTIIVCALYSIMLIAQAIEMIQYWYQAKLLSKYTSLVSLTAYFVVSVYKIFLLASSKEVYWFALSNSIDYFIIGFALLALYFKLGGQKLQFSKGIAKRMLSSSKHYIISGLMVTAFLQIDKVMLKMMLGDAATGYYSAAVTCAGMSSFVFTAIIDSLRPVIFEGKKESTATFEGRVIQLYNIIVYFALLQSIIFSVLATPIIHILYGVQYEPAIIILRIIVWYTTFSYYGGAKDVWILAENQQKYLVLLNASGAIGNVILNYFMIKAWGACGAAVASVITQVFTNIIMMFIIKNLRHNNWLLLKALNPVVFFNNLRGFKRLFIK